MTMEKINIAETNSSHHAKMSHQYYLSNLQQCTVHYTIFLITNHHLQRPQQMY